MILGKPNIKFEYKDLKIEKYNTDHKDLESILLKHAKNETVLWIKGNPVYTDDIRADYINRVLYAPVFKCDTITSDDGKLVNYNNRIEKEIIHSFDGGYQLDSLLVQTELTSPVVKSIELSGLSLREHARGEELEARDLFERYVAYSYMYHISEEDIFKFIRVQASKMTQYQREYIKSHGLDFYGEYVDTNYRDVRQWKLMELKGKIPDDTLLLGESFGFRRLNFELELYSRLYSKEYWENWTLGTMSDLLNNKRDYLKYKYNSIYLIFKKRWLVS